MKHFTLLTIILIISCTQDNSIDPELFIPSSADLEDKFEFEFISADTIRVFSNESADFVAPNFSSIIVLKIIRFDKNNRFYKFTMNYVNSSI